MAPINMADFIHKFQDHTGRSPILARDDDDDDHDSTYVNWYYAIIAVFVVLVLVVLYGGRRRAQHRKAILLSRRHTALQQDASGWPSSRRWMYGNWRSETTQEQRYAAEGLDQTGEAPPPYNPNDSASRVIAVGPIPDNSTAAAEDLTRPAPVLTRAASTNKPPEYAEAVQPPAISPSATAQDSTVAHWPSAGQSHVRAAESVSTEPSQTQTPAVPPQHSAAR